MLTGRAHLVQQQRRLPVRWIICSPYAGGAKRRLHVYDLRNRSSLIMTPSIPELHIGNTISIDAAQHPSDYLCTGSTRISP